MDVERVPHAPGTAMKRFLDDLYPVLIEMLTQFVMVERAGRKTDMIDIAHTGHRRRCFRSARVTSHKTINDDPNHTCSIPSPG